MAGRTPPSVTIGIPAYNEEDNIETTVRSAMAQRDDDLEILIVDNASTDRTGEICSTLAASDERIRYERNDTNIGNVGNFARVFELASGDWLRWLGAHDTLEPGYVEACRAAISENPGASVVTTLIKYVLDDGTEKVGLYFGERPDQADPISRLATMLHLLTESPFNIDPGYSLIRRDALSLHRLRLPLRFSDEIMACDLAVAGRFVHVNEMLATRPWSTPRKGTKALRNTTGTGEDRIGDVARAAVQRPLMMWEVTATVRQTQGLSGTQRVRGHLLMFGYVVRLIRRRFRRLMRRVTLSIRGATGGRG